MARRAARWLTAAIMTATVIACNDRARVAEPPTAEFLVAAGDSTYWVRSGVDGVRIRRAPILLTRVENRFYEIFIADDVVDFDEAAFASARLYARDVAQTDSVLLFADSTVSIEAARWRRAHPHAEPLDADADAPAGNPATSVSDDIEIVDVHGPWITLTHLLDVDVTDSTRHRHTGRRMVIDLRTGQRASLAAMFDSTEAARVVATAQAAFGRLTDSIRTASDQRAATARVTLPSFRFDSTSFGLTAVAQSPAIAFMVPGTALDGAALALNLPPVEIAAPAWWTATQATRPVWAKDSSTFRWRGSGYTVVARPDSSGETLALTLQASAASTGATARGTARGTAPVWPLLTVPTPAYEWLPIDVPPLPTALRDALARAFDAASAHDGTVQAAVARRRLRPMRRGGA
ncbi:MAG: hypothetical protein WCK74_08580 [Gemmatimonadaceae bacterium]